MVENIEWLAGPGSLPSPAQLEAQIGTGTDCTQLWIQDGCGHPPALQPEHVAVIKEFWSGGRGLMILNDNDPCFADTNIITKELVKLEVFGNFDVTADDLVTTTMPLY